MYRDIINYLGRTKATTTEQFSRQAYHAVQIIKQALAAGIKALEPSQAAQDAWVATVAPSAAFSKALQSECPPSYLNNEGGKFRYYLGDYYLGGFHAYEKMMQEWRDAGKFEGLELTR